MPQFLVVWWEHKMQLYVSWLEEKKKTLIGWKASWKVSSVGYIKVGSDFCRRCRYGQKDYILWSYWHGRSRKNLQQHDVGHQYDWNCRDNEFSDKTRTRSKSVQWNHQLVNRALMGVGNQQSRSRAQPNCSTLGKLRRRIFHSFDHKRFGARFKCWWVNWAKGKLGRRINWILFPQRLLQIRPFLWAHSHITSTAWWCRKDWEIKIFPSSTTSLKMSRANKVPVIKSAAAFR